MSERATDLAMLGELLGEHAGELSDTEVEAFAGMRFDLTSGLRGERFEQLTEKQRSWVKSVHERLVPQYANLVSQGLVPRGTPTAESRALDAMLAGPKVTKPPPRRQPCEQCGAKDASLVPDPYAEEILGNSKPCWLCSDCWRANARDI